jgi:hypothetical protein
VMRSAAPEMPLWKWIEFAFESKSQYSRDFFSGKRG